MDINLQRQIQNNCQTLGFRMPESFRHAWSFLFDFCVNTFGLDVTDIYEDFTYRKFLEVLIGNTNQGELIPDPRNPANLTGEHFGKLFANSLFNYNNLWENSVATTFTFLEMLCPGFIKLYNNVEYQNTGVGVIDFVLNGFWLHMHPGFQELENGIVQSAWNSHKEMYLWFFDENIIIFVNPLNGSLKQPPVKYHRYVNDLQKEPEHE